MIRAKRQGDGFVHICDCGNADQDRFINYAKPILIKDKNGREKFHRVMALTCRICDTSTTFKEIQAALEVDKEPSSV